MSEALKWGGDSINLSALDWLFDNLPTGPQPWTAIVPLWAMLAAEKIGITHRQMIGALTYGAGRSPGAIWVETGFGEGFCWWKEENDRP